jgi:GNAT superfamily N-acetyltransferase
VSIDISPIETERLSFTAWKIMWLDYLGKQAEALGADQHQITYSRLVNSDFNLFGVVAGGAEPIGFAHFYFHPSTFHANEDCCLQDLYAHPSARGRGLGRALVEQVATVARTRGAPILHWKTRESNVTARSMYARFAQRSEYVSFRLPL